MNFESQKIRSTHTGMPVADEFFKVGILLLKIPSLKPTASSHLKMDGWNTMKFIFGAFRPIFRVAFKVLVSGRVYLV